MHFALAGGAAWSGSGRILRILCCNLTGCLYFSVATGSPVTDKFPFKRKAFDSADHSLWLSFYNSAMHCHPAIPAALAQGLYYFDADDGSGYGPFAGKPCICRLQVQYRFSFAA